MRRALILAGLVVLFLPAATATADPEDVAADIASEIASPFCEGVTLHDCPSRAAVDLRNQIEEWARAGWSRDRILDRLEDQFGSTIYAAPPKEGAGLIAWLLPAAALAVGAAVALRSARRWTRRPAAGSPAAAPMTADERARLDAELTALERAEEGGAL